VTLLSEDVPVTDTASQSSNHLLAVLPRSEFLEITPHLTTVELVPKQSMAEPNHPITSVYFPLNAVISVTASGENGGSVEVGSVGCEGILGLPVLFGSDRSTNGALAQIGGRAECMAAEVLQRELARHQNFRRVLHLYAQGFFTQIAQSTACNRLHAAELRLARWLLICRDRVGRDDIPITHEAIALMLGVRRATVTEAAGSLQARGLIRYRRGLVSIVDRERLEGASCPCYQIVRNEFDRLLGVRVG
jgi:CRP-like cAMP-binding protein